MHILYINLENLNGQGQKYLMYLSIINCITFPKMIKDYQVHWELKRYPIKKRKMHWTYWKWQQLVIKKISVILRDRNLVNVYKNAIVICIK